MFSVVDRFGYFPVIRVATPAFCCGWVDCIFTFTLSVRTPDAVDAWTSMVCSPEARVEAFQEAVSLDPTYHDAAVGLAYALFELGRYREALPHLHRLTREGAYIYFPDPHSDVEELRSHYAWCLYYTGGYEKARDEFAKGIQARPKRAGLHDGLGWTYLKLGDRAKARESFQRALQLDPDYADARAGLAEANR